MSDSTLPVSEPNSTSTLLDKPGVLVAKKHHLLVRWSHWLNLPILLGLIVSGISIYWLRPSINTSQIRIRETSMWRRILESGYAATCPDCITSAVHLTGCTLTFVSGRACWLWLCACIGSA